MIRPLRRQSFHLRLQCAALSMIVANIAGSGLGADAPKQQLTQINAKLESGDEVLFATFGDSITLPCYHTDYHQNYITLTVDALRQAYPDANIKIVHAGNMGNTDRGLDAGRFEKHVLAFKPDVIFIMFGMNDCGGGPPGLTNFDKNLVTLIRKSQAAGAIPVLATQNEILYDSVDGRFRTHLPKYMQRTLDVAKREGVPAVDCFELWRPLRDDPRALAARLNDWIHPNLAGHRLMAKAIVQTLWPDAAKSVSTDVRTPPKLAEAKSFACLVPGPPGKQVVRAGETWCALSGRRRAGRLTDLVFSYCRAAQPGWSDFRHVTLIGPRRDAVFDAMDRTLTAAMFLKRGKHLYIVFSSNAGVFMLTLDEPPTGGFEEWEASLMQSKTWLGRQEGPFVRPTVLANSIFREGGILFDAYLQTDGWPAVLCWGRKLHPGGGFEIVDGVDGIEWVTRPSGAVESDREFIIAEHNIARCMTAQDGTVFFAAQKERGGALTLGILGNDQNVRVADVAVNRFLLPPAGSAGSAVVQRSLPSENPAAARWRRIEWKSEGERIVYTVGPVQPAENRSSMIPLPWSDGSGQGVLWWRPDGSQRRPMPMAYESHLSTNSKRLGLMTGVDRTIEFFTRPIER